MRAACPKVIPCSIFVPMRIAADVLPIARVTDVGQLCFSSNGANHLRQTGGRTLPDIECDACFHGANKRNEVVVRRIERPFFG